MSEASVALLKVLVRHYSSIDQFLCYERPVSNIKFERNTRYLCVRSGFFASLDLSGESCRSRVAPIKVSEAVPIVTTNQLPQST